MPMNQIRGTFRKTRKHLRKKVERKRNVFVHNPKLIHLTINILNDYCSVYKIIIHDIWEAHEIFDICLITFLFLVKKSIIIS